MTQKELDSPASMPLEIGGDDLPFVQQVRLVWRYRWLVVTLLFASLLATFVVTQRMPRIYESTATLMAPREGGGLGLLGNLGLSGLVQQVPGLSVPSLTPNRDLLLSLLKSRTVAEAVVERFDLQKRYAVRFREDAIKALRDATNVALSKEGVISITVEDREPVVAAEIANFYLERLDRTVSEYSTGEAGRQRAFLVSQLAAAKAKLGSAEETLRRFQERNRAVVLQEQTRGAIEAAARLKGEIVAAEVQLQVMRSFATDANPEVAALRRRIDEMKRQLSQMEYGDGVGRPVEPGRARRDFSVPFSRVPEVGLELARLTRDVKVQETLVGILAQQFEQAKLIEARDMPVVQVLDRAVALEQHTKPRLRVNLAIAAIAGLLIAVVIAYSVEFVRGLAKARSR